MTTEDNGARQKRRQAPKVRGRRGGAKVGITPAAAGIVYDGKSLDDWDDEELLRGRKKNKNGKFNGRPPLVIPAELHKELTRRRFSRAHDIMAASLVDGALMLRSIVNDDSAENADRIKAVELMFNRILGKPREQVSLAMDVQVGAAPKYESLMESAIVSTVEEAALYLERKRAASEEASEEVIGEIVEEEDDDEE